MFFKDTHRTQLVSSSAKLQRMTGHLLTTLTHCVVVTTCKTVVCVRIIIAVSSRLNTAPLTVHVACFTSCFHWGRRAVGRRGLWVGGGGGGGGGSSSSGASSSPAATAGLSTGGLRHRAAERDTFRLEVPSERRERWDTET